MNSQGKNKKKVKLNYDLNKINEKYLINPYFSSINEKVENIKELQKLIGKNITIAYDGRNVFIARDFADEYTGSKDTWKNKQSIRKAKANAASGVEQIVSSAKNPNWMKNSEAKHNIDAARGWTYYDVNFAIDDGNNLVYYSGILNVRMDADGKDYLYDITIIKKVFV